MGYSAAGGSQRSPQARLSSLVDGGEGQGVRRSAPWWLRTAEFSGCLGSVSGAIGTASLTSTCCISVLAVYMTLTRDKKGH